MIPILMQDWVTTRGNGVTVIQSAPLWIRTARLQDAFFSLDVRETASPGVTFSIETSPNRDDALFQACVAGFQPAVGMNYSKVIASLATTSVPIAEWTRWKIVFASGSISDITFRVLMHGNAFC